MYIYKMEILACVHCVEAKAKINFLCLAVLLSAVVLKLGKASKIFNLLST